MQSLYMYISSLLANLNLSYTTKISVSDLKKMLSVFKTFWYQELGNTSKSNISGGTKRR